MNNLPPIMNEDAPAAAIRTIHFQDDDGLVYWGTECEQQRIIELDWEEAVACFKQWCTEKRAAAMQQATPPRSSLH